MTGPLPTLLSQVPLAISTDGLTKTYGDATVLRDLALQVPLGSVYLLVGPNGAGKSTTMKILLDLVRPDSGTAEVLGYSSRDQGSLVRANVGYVPEQLDWGYTWLKVGRLLEHHSRYFPSWDDAYAKHLFKSFDLRLNQTVATLSKGQGRRVHLAMSLAHRPPVLILDEPTDGLDPVMRDEMFRVLTDHLSDTPTTVLFSTHHVGEVERLADHIGVLADGQLRAQLPLHDLRNQMRRYRASIPPGWQGGHLFRERVMRRITTHNEIDWTVWGEEESVARELAGAGASVRDISLFTLEETTLLLLTRPEIVR